MDNLARKTPSGTTCLLLAVALFAVGAVVRAALGDFPKALDVLPDERRYLEIARSLFSGNGLVMRGEASDFQKILYPLSLFPALAFDGGQAQIRAVNVLNAVYASSVVFPALLIARKVFRDPRAVVASLAFAAVAPDAMYSMTFMSESLFLPVSLWMVYLCWRSFEAKGARAGALSLLAGLLGYATYLCKEVGWMFPIAFAAWHVMAAASKRQPARLSAVRIAAFAAGFFIPFAAMKLTLFSGLGNSYGQFSFDILLSPYTVLFGWYSALLDGVYFVVGFGVFPVIYLACTYREMPREQRDLLFFCLVSLLIGLAVVVFTISMREDVGHVALRQHLRYVAPLSLPLLMLFMKQASRLDPARITRSPRRLSALVGVTVGFCVLTGMLFGAGNLGQGFDFAQFHLLRWLMDGAGTLPQEYFDGWSQQMRPISADDGALLDIWPAMWAIRAAIIAYTALGTAALLSSFKRTRLQGAAAICALIGVMMVLNSAAAWHYNRNAYEVEPAAIEEICAISDQLAARQDQGEVIVVLDKANTGPNNLVDTYLQDGAGDYRYIPVGKLDDEDIERAGYVLVNTGQDVELDEGRFKKIGGSDDEAARFELYEALEPQGNGPSPIPARER